MKKRMDCGRKRNLVGIADNSDRNRVRDGTVARFEQLVQRRGRPGGPRRLKECPALCGRLQMALARGHESRRKFGDLRQPDRVA